MPTIDFNLADFEDDIKREYCCNDNCLANENLLLQGLAPGNSLKYALQDYIKQMEQNLYGYIDNKGLIKTYEEVYNDLKDLLADYEE